MASATELSSLASVRPNFALGADMVVSSDDPAELKLYPPSAAFRERALVASRAEVSFYLLACPLSGFREFAICERVWIGDGGVA